MGLLLGSTGPVGARDHLITSHDWIQGVCPHARHTRLRPFWLTGSIKGGRCGNRGQLGKKKNVQSRPPATQRNFTRCPKHPQAHRTPRPPGETHWPMRARVNTAASDPYLNPSAPDPFDTLPGFHTLKHPFRNPGQQNALGPSPVGSVPCLLLGPPRQARPPQPPRVSGRPGRASALRAPGDTRPAGHRRHSRGSKPLRLCQRPRISRPLVIIPPALCLPTQTV